MTVRLRSTTEVMTTNNACKSTALARPGNIHKLLVLENIDQNFVTDLDLAVRLRLRILALRLLLARFLKSGDGDFLHELHRRKVVLAEVSLHRLGNALALYEFDETNLDRIVPVTRSILPLRDHARAGLQNRDGPNLALVIEELGHADFFS